MDRFERRLEEVKNRDETTEEAEERVEAGDECPKGGCEREIFELHHGSHPEPPTEPHPDAAEVEAVCIHHGIVDSR